MISAKQLGALDPQMRQTMLSLMAELQVKDELIARRDREAAFKQALIEIVRSRHVHRTEALAKLRSPSGLQPVHKIQPSLLP